MGIRLPNHSRQLELVQVVVVEYTYDFRLLSTRDFSVSMRRSLFSSSCRALVFIGGGLRANSTFRRVAASNSAYAKINENVNISYYTYFYWYIHT